MTKIEKTVREINDLWLFYQKISRQRRALGVRKTSRQRTRKGLKKHRAPSR